MKDALPLKALIDVGPPDGPLLVLLHGRGSDERDLLPIGPLLHPDATTVSVRAPFDAAPWGYGPGFAWYQFLGGVVPESTSFTQGQDALAQTIAGLPAYLGRPETRMVLGGFSQGGTSALALMMRNPGAVNGVMVFSGFLADHPSVEVTPARVRTTPIFWGHGTSDGAVPFADAERGWGQLRAAGAALETHAYPGMGHSISEVELRDAARWLAPLVERRNDNGAP